MFTANVLSDMFDRFGDDIRIKKVDGETYSVDVTVQISKTFFAWLVGTQGKVKIKSPQKVIDESNAFVAKIRIVIMKKTIMKVVSVCFFAILVCSFSVCLFATSVSAATTRWTSILSMEVVMTFDGNEGIVTGVAGKQATASNRARAERKR